MGNRDFTAALEAAAAAGGLSWVNAAVAKATDGHAPPRPTPVGSSTAEWIQAAEKCPELIRAWRAREMDTSALIGTLSNFSSEAGGYVALLEASGLGDEANKLKDALTRVDRDWQLAIIEERYAEITAGIAEHMSPQPEEIELLAQLATGLCELQLAEKLRLLVSGEAPTEPTTSATESLPERLQPPEGVQQDAEDLSRD